MQTPGTVVVDKHFINHKGEEQHKYSVLLTDGKKLDHVTVLMTSKQHGRDVIYGCQTESRFPNFFLPAACTPFLPLDTWVDLGFFFFTDPVDLKNGLSTNTFYKRGVLSRHLTEELLECAYRQKAVSLGQRGMIEDCLETYFRK